MTVCPVCEHPQAEGNACDVCGKVFLVARTVDVPVQTLGELEGTRYDGEPLATPVQTLPELEGTALRGGPDLPAAPIPELERTKLEGHSDTPILPLDEMELGRAEDDGIRTAAPTGPLTCRYCRNVQADGAFCDRCGMRLPRASGDVAAPVGALAEGEWTVCTACGSRAQMGRPCGECGVTMHPEA
jgi:hypothetical protein